MRNIEDRPANPVALQLQNLTKQFGDLVAVNNISFEIHQNEIFGLLGPNGAGESTTINIICGLLPSTAGSVNYIGYGNKDFRSIIGYCPQENIYYPKLSCLEQLLFTGQMYGIHTKAVKESAWELLKLLGLSDKAHSRACDLSGGMKRRLNICLALIHDPAILILDEPEAGLDPQSRILVRDVIKKMGKEKAVILTTHNMDEADRLADRIAIVDHGKLLMLDTPQNLKRTVGEGDILEIGITQAKADAITAFLHKAAPFQINKTADALLIRHPNIINKLSAIKSIADNCKLEINEWRLRENTLEDVFIHLTGRNLRQ